MTTLDSSSLIDRSIELLESLAAELANEVAMRPPGPAGADERAHRRKEALLTISVLIPKLRAASRPAAPQAVPTLRCRSCEGD